LSLKPNLIIIDHLQQDSSSNKLCLELKANESTNKVPVLIMSTNKTLALIAENSREDAYLCYHLILLNLEQQSKS
jgi:DNA-binding response OmpR family regulator